MECRRAWLQTPRLTGREREIVAFLLDGRSNREIAYILNLSPLTVRDHLSRLLDKLQARNRTQLLAEAVEPRRRQHRRLRL